MACGPGYGRFAYAGPLPRAHPSMAVTSLRGGSPPIRRGSVGSGTVPTHWDECRLAVAVSVILRDLQPQGHRWWGASIKLELQLNPEPALALLQPWPWPSTSVALVSSEGWSQLLQPTVCHKSCSLQVGLCSLCTLTTLLKSPHGKYGKGRNRSREPSSQPRLMDQC